MAVGSQVRGVLFVTAAMDVVLGLLFLVFGSALFGLEGWISLLIGLVLIAGGLAMFVFARVMDRRNDSGDGDGGVVDRR